MNKKLMSIILIVCMSVLMFSNTVMAAEENGDEGGIMDALPEIIVATIGVIGLIVLVTSTKEIGGTVGKGFKFIKIGFAFFAAGFILMAVSELMGFKASIELIFEVLVLIGMILIAYGPRKIADTLKYISILER